MPTKFFAVDFGLRDNRSRQVDDVIDGHAQLIVDGFNRGPKLFQLPGCAFTDGGQRIAVDLLVERFLR